MRAVGTAAAALALVASQLAWPVAAAPAGPGEPARQAAAAAGPPEWAPAEAATIFPGARIKTGNLFCTANFVFYDAKGNAYVGQAARCAGAAPSADADKDGCAARSLPLGTNVLFPDSRVTGTLAYSSWITMQEDVGEKDVTTCRANDFALIRVPDFAIGQVNPSVPLFGGPVGLDSDGTEPGEIVVGWANSDIRGTMEDVKARQGFSVGDGPGNWVHLIYGVTPSIDGDGGGPYLDGGGNALGSLQGTIVGPPPAADAITDVAKALAYARRHSGIEGLQLALGTKKFEGPYVVSPLVNQVVPPPRR